MKVGVVGLGLIGGSMAKAVKKKTEHTVLGWDVSETIRYSALLMEAVHGFMEDGNPKDCDLILLGLYPQLTIEYIKAHAKDFKKGAVVVDCAGVKRVVCEQVQAVAKKTALPSWGRTLWQAWNAPALPIPQQICSTAQRWL